ncbi:nuclear transport factor 2 family protein [Thalassospira povalilytica]|uniref:Nuclear transport factor 2 family protein n=1 Tax=Thalassospira povalilytica TaxID=732237 RepID=A0A8I1MAP1_9PROT|nr:nuclear transport factor 2 family protein [Thalassospira povalilytica]MBN8198538.1 nuclear transport factor 2 family protein [Thalassospira povalilytica]
MNETENRKRHLIAAYGAYFENLSPETVNELSGMVTDDFTFSDPFTTRKGPDDVCAYLGKTFTDTENPNFVVTHEALDGDIGFLRWQFSAKIPVIGHWEFCGMTELTFNQDGSLLASHVDYWDSGQHFYGKLPVLGWIIKRLARRVAG